MYWATEGLKQKKGRKSEHQEGQGNFWSWSFRFFEWRQNYNSGKCQSNCHTFSPKGILGNFSGPYPYIYPFAQIQRPSFCFLCLSRCLSFCWLFPVTFEGRVCLAWTDIFNSVSLVCAEVSSTWSKSTNCTQIASDCQHVER